MKDNEILQFFHYELTRKNIYYDDLHVTKQNFKATSSFLLHIRYVPYKYRYVIIKSVIVDALTSYPLFCPSSSIPDMLLGSAGSKRSQEFVSAKNSLASCTRTVYCSTNF
jgi:hypothetical protein